jgi:ribonuclease P protein component
VITDSMTGKFERTRRIVKTDEFSSVFRLRPVFKTEHLVLYVRPNALPHARLGVVAAKRLAPRAVTRNTVKRAVREGFRQSELLHSLGLDCVVRLSKSVGNKQQPACTSTIQALLLSEVKNLFAIPAKFNKVLEAARQAAVAANAVPADVPNASTITTVTISTDGAAL